MEVAIYETQEWENPDMLEHAGVSGVDALPARLIRYGNAKTGAINVADYIASLPACQALEKLHHRLTHCGDYLLFRHFTTIDQVKLHAAHLCAKHLLCPLCAIRRGAKFLAAYLERFERIRLSAPHLKPYLLTLTVRDGSSLKERFNHLFKSQRELWKRKQRGQKTTLKGIDGAVWSYEVKRGKNSKQWHPHLHMICLTENPPSRKALRDEWYSITGDSFEADIRPINPIDPVSGFSEVFKYAVKFSSQLPADTYHAFITLKGKRLLASSGIFRGVPEPDNLLDDTEALADLPYIDLFYRYVRDKGYISSNVNF